MTFFSGSQLAVAIEDLANRELLESEDILGDRITRELCTHLPVRAEDVPRKLINGFMRGSTTIKDEQLADEIAILQRKLDDRQDPMLVVALVKHSIDRERKDIHIKRTQKSAVKQILRAVKDDLDLVETTRSTMIASFKRTKDDLLVVEIHSEGAVFDWADQVQRLYEDLFVSDDKSSLTNSFKPRGIVSRLAASNYSNSWIRFIKERAHQIYELAPLSKPLMTQSLVESSLSFKLKRESTQRGPSHESIRVSITNDGQGIFQTWASKAEARRELSSFISILSTLVDVDDEIESVEISIATTNEINISLKAVTQSKIEKTLSKLLSD